MNLIDKDALLMALAEAQKQPCVSLRKLIEDAPVYVLETRCLKEGAEFSVLHSPTRQIPRIVID